MQRREFLKRSIAAGAATLCPVVRARSAEIPTDIVITGIVGFDLATRRSKVAGKNARLDVHGDGSRDPMLRVYTSAGIDGLGRCSVSEETATKLLGQPVADLFDATTASVDSVLGSQSMPIWDLVGKLLDKPVSELLGRPRVTRVPVYDGSVYFFDLLPQYAANWQDRLKEELDQGINAGHRAFKLKIGRGSKWMPRLEGDQRDIEIVRLARQHVGKIVLLGVDANNGYDFSGAKRLISEVGEYDIAFGEELFDETVQGCLELKAHIEDLGLDTRVADGESQRTVDAFRPFVEAEAIDILQGDMNHFGFEGIRAEAALADPKDIQVAPHNWGSLLGFYAQLQIGATLANFYMAEHDPLQSNLINADGYKIENGTCSVPNSSGMGLTINERTFQQVEPRFVIHA